MGNEPMDKKLDDLFAAARKYDPFGSDRPGFESRLMARINFERKEDESLPFWTWRLVPFFVSIIIIAAVWLYASGMNTGIDLGSIANLDQEGSIVAALGGE